MKWPALSIRQPWAWFIVNGLKDIENRSWPTRFRGEFYVHASKGMTHDEYDSAWWFAEKAAPGRFILPAFEDMERGGIVGRAEIVDCVKASESPWFVGEFGFVLRDASRLPFRPCRGALGFFLPEPPSLNAGLPERPLAPTGNQR